MLSFKAIFDQKPSFYVNKSLILQTYCFSKDIADYFLLLFVYFNQIEQDLHHSKHFVIKKILGYNQHLLYKTKLSKLQVSHT